MPSISYSELEPIIREITRQEIRKILAEELGIEIQGSVFTLVSPEQAARKLGYTSYVEIYRAVESGLFRLGIEVHDRRLPNSNKPRYWFDLAKCQERIKAA